MKKILIGLSIVSVLALGTLAFAHSQSGWGSGHMMGSGNGGHMMGQGYGGGHMGQGKLGRDCFTNQGKRGNPVDQKFLDETADLRKELHDKRFEYAETARNPETTIASLRNIEKEIYELETKIYEKNPDTNREYDTGK